MKKESVKKATYIGIGAALVAKERLEKLAKDLKKKSADAEKKGRTFAGRLQKMSKAELKKFEKDVKKQTENALKQLAVLSRKELQKLSKRLAAFEKKDSKNSRKAAGRKTAKKAKSNKK